MRPADSPPPDLPESPRGVPAVEARLREAQAELASILVTGRSADGTVAVLASGLGRLNAVQVDPRVYAERDVQRLQQAIVEAVRAAGVTASRIATQRMGPVEINLH